jgi:hypothetical protein
MAGNGTKSTHPGEDEKKQKENNNTAEYFGNLLGPFPSLFWVFDPFHKISGK